MRYSQYLLEFETTECAAELYLNDIPLFHFDERTTMQRLCGPVDALLVRGPNPLRIALGPGPGPTVPIGGRVPATAKVRARLFYRGPDAGDTGERTLVTLEWPQPRVTPIPLPGPVTTQATTVDLDPSTPTGGWQWQRATLKPVIDINTILHRLHASLSARDTGPLMALSQPLLYDVAWSQAVDPAQHEQRLRTALAEMLADPDFRLEPLKDMEKKLQTRLVAGGRLVDVLCDDWLPPLRAGTPGTETWFAVRLRLGLLKGVPYTFC